MESVQKGPMFMRTIRATRVARLCQLRCINNAIKPINTCHSRDRISCPRRPLHPSARHQKRCSPLHAKARRWKASNPEPAHRAHSDAEKHSIVLLTVSGTLIRAIAVGRGGNYPRLSLARDAIHVYPLGRMPCVATCARNMDSQLVLPRKQSRRRRLSCL